MTDACYRRRSPLAVCAGPTKKDKPRTQRRCRRGGSATSFLGGSGRVGRSVPRCRTFPAARRRTGLAVFPHPALRSLRIPAHSINGSLSCFPTTGSHRFPPPKLRKSANLSPIEELETRLDDTVAPCCRGIRIAKYSLRFQHWPRAPLAAITARITPRHSRRICDGDIICLLQSPRHD
jgi:hypothetical protein